MRSTRAAAFTLLESLLVLGLTSFLALTLAGGISQTFARAEEAVFFLSFEQIYQDTQAYSQASQSAQVLEIGQAGIRNGQRELALPAGIGVERSYRLTFYPDKGSSSLEKISFQTANKQVSYQLQLGSGRYKKTER